jgi:iron complex transport system substrate-binding protein
MKKRTMRKARWKSLTAVAALCLMVVVGLGAIGCSNTASDQSGQGANQEATSRTITDMAGRSVTIPMHPTKVMGAANPDGILIYSIDPSLLTGWTFDLNDGAKKYLTSDAAALPKNTSVSKWEDINEEEILNIDPDFILVTADLSNTDLSLYDQLTADTGIPVVVCDAQLSNLDQTYEFLGTILDQSDQCQKCADYVSKAFKNVDGTMDKVGTSKLRVLYSTGKDGLQTCGDSNWNGQFVTPAGGINVCDTNQTSGFAQVSMEQVLGWQPDAIISTATGDKASIYGTTAWADLSAIKNHKVYAAPQAPFSWVDKPTGVNRIIGVEWANSVLYPSEVTYDIKAEVKEFYKTFYHYDLTDDETASLLNTQVSY